MKKIAQTALVGTLAASAGLLVWQGAENQANEVRKEIRFHQSTSWDFETVYKCIKSGNARHIFEDYKHVSVSRPSSKFASTLIDGQGSSLVIERLNSRTEVRLSSARQFSEEQEDLLQWCVLNPDYTWIAPEFRSKG